MKQIILGIILIYSAAGIAESMAQSGDQLPTSQQPRPALPLSVSALYGCADSLSTIYFRTKESNLTYWKAKSGSQGDGEFEYPSVAITTVILDEFNGKKGPGFLSISEKHVYFTPTEFKRDDLGYLSTHVTLNLSGKIDNKWNLPVVDSRDYVSGSWYTRVTLVPKENPTGAAALTEFHNLNPNHTEIAPHDALFGDSAAVAIQYWTRKLRTLILSAPEVVSYVHGENQMAGRAIPDTELEFVRKGLCGCASAFPAETERVRTIMTSRSYSTSIRDSGRVNSRVGGNSEIRRIQGSDLSCTMY